MILEKLNSKIWKTRNWYETFLVYTIKLSGLWYRIKSLSGYFHMIVS